jgi:hypothetical protein
MTKNINNNSINNNNSSSSNNNVNNSLNIDIQAQFELCVELRRFINIDLFQRGLVS